MEEKPKKTMKIKHRSRIGRTSNFLQQKRAMPYFKAKNKNKIKNWKKQMEELEQNADYDIVKDNFRHFFHLNLEDSVFDRELANLEHLFTPLTYWFLINDSYFQNNIIKDRMQNLIKEHSISNYNNKNILKFNEDNGNYENLSNQYMYKNGYKYISILNEQQETKIKSDFFIHVKSIIDYLKKTDNNNNNNNDNEYNNQNNNNNLSLTNDVGNNVNQITTLENDKELINKLIKNIHQLNEQKINDLNNIINNNILNDEKKKLSTDSSEKDISSTNKCNNYIKINPLFEQDNESLLISNKFIDYIQKNEKTKFQKYEESKKIFSFSEKFINNRFHNQIVNTININYCINDTNNNNKINDNNNNIINEQDIINDGDNNNDIQEEINQNNDNDNNNNNINNYIKEKIEENNNNNNDNNDIQEEIEGNNNNNNDNFNNLLKEENFIDYIPNNNKVKEKNIINNINDNHDNLDIHNNNLIENNNNYILNDNNKKSEENIMNNVNNINNNNNIENNNDIDYFNNDTNNMNIDDNNNNISINKDINKNINDNIDNNINNIDNNNNKDNNNNSDHNSYKDNKDDNNSMNDFDYNNIIKMDRENDKKKNLESPIAYINNYLVNKEENYNLINQGICCICNNGDVEQNQFLLKCEQCNVTVHQNCYGAQVKELYNWVCDACKEMSKEEVYKLECLLCPVLGGAFKKIELPIESTFYKNIMDYKHKKIKLPKNNYNIIIPKKNYHKVPFAWVHLSCALWNPNINLKNYENKTGIFIENINYEDFNSTCSLCKKDNCGPTIKCNNNDCNISYHPECARINNCCLEVEIINKEYQYNVYCYKHKPNLLAKRINYNCQNEIQQIIAVNQELNNIYDLYKKVYKNDLYQKAKVINQIEILADSFHSRKHKKYKNHINIFNNTNSTSSVIRKYNKLKHLKSLENIVINLSKRGRKKKCFKNIHNINNSYYSNINTKKKKKSKIITNTKKLKTIKIENFNNASTIINNIGNGNNINIYVNNFNNLPNYSISNNKSKSETKRYDKDYNINNYPSPTIEINKKEFDKLTNNNYNSTGFDVDEYIKDKKEFIVYLIGFLNDYTSNNRIIIKKNNIKNSCSIDKTSPIYYLKYDDFQKSNIPWEEIGYNNLPSSILRKAFFAIIPDEKQYKKLFLDKITKTLKDLKKNKKFEKYTIDCDNKEKCIGAPKGVYNLLSLDIFKYKILDEKHFFPKNFLCSS